MKVKAPATIRFPVVPGSGTVAVPRSRSRPPRDAGGFDASEERITEPAIAIPRPAVKDRAHLTLLSGPSAGEIYPLGTVETIIGRDEDAQLRPEDAAISRRHARIVRQPSGDFILEDLASTNGTYVGMEQIRSRLLRSGDQIQVGPNVIYRFALTDETEERLQRQLFESSIRDPLTQAYNRKYLNERLVAEVAHAHRHGTKLALLMLDLDEFKRTNDRHGHLGGDTVLRQVGVAVTALIRVEDVFARYGGEEFVVLTRGDGVHNAMQLAERLRRGIGLLKVEHEGVAIPVTVSIGVAELDELDPESGPENLLGRADGRLYAAKRLGRNRVVWNDS